MAAVGPRLVIEKDGMFQRLRSEFAEPSTDKVAALEDVAVAEGMKENMTVVELMGADMTVEAMEECMTVGARGHCS